MEPDARPGQVAELEGSLAAALEQLTAVSEILRVTASSPGDVKPMLNAVAERALKLCDAAQSGIFLIEGNVLRFAARYGSMSTPMENEYFPLTRGFVVGRAAIDRETIHHPDIIPLLDTEYPDAREPQQKFGFRAILGVPLMREDCAIGTIALWRTEARAFTERQIALVKTFADQAAIAIENVRLFDEVQARTRELSESLQQQTATADVLKVISRSAFDLQTVLHTLTKSACELCEADGAIWRPDGDGFKVAALFGQSPLHKVALRQRVIRPGRDTCVGRALLEGRVVHIRDAQADPEYNVPDVLNVTGIRAMLGVPLLREGVPIGVLVLTRTVVRPFTEKQSALATTFADQAVIAIENVRLFRETKEALEQQTATSEILRVISQSPMSVQPVFDTIVGATLKLCSGRSANLFTFDGRRLHLAAHARPIGGGNDAVAVDLLAMQRNFPRPPGRDLAAPRAVLTCSVVSIPDVLADAEYTFKEAALAGGFRSVLAVPLIREGSPIGAIVVGRPEPGPFPETQVALLKTFADQAVIAIENVRLFNETKEALEQQRASGEVLAAISNSIADTSPVFEMILTSCERLFAGKMAVIDLVGEDGLVHLGAYHGPRLDEVKRVYPHTIDTTSATGTAIATRGVVHFAHIDDVPETAHRAFEVFGIKAAIGAPMLWEGKGIGAIWVARDYAGPFSEKDITLLKTFADQAVIAIQNARLIREIEEKSRELEAASRHKSEFLANMSHELRTPLNAIIGFSEVLSERMFGEVNDKQAEYLRDILESGQHLLSLINDILDLSKIEAGRMELEPTDFDLPSAIGNTLTLVRERAHRRSITLERTVDERLGMIHADERKVKQVLLNLLSNALKFTPEGGRIDIRAAMRDGTAEISVTDTGVGIAPEDQEAVFEEFRQVGTASKKVEGTGLGLAISRKLIELHGGRIWASSEVGIGSTFAFTLPLQ